MQSTDTLNLIKYSYNIFIVTIYTYGLLLIEFLRNSNRYLKSIQLNLHEYWPERKTVDENQYFYNH